MNTLIRAGALAALGFAAFRAIRFLLDSGRARSVADAKAVCWEGEGGDLSPTSISPRGFAQRGGRGGGAPNPLEETFNGFV